jgi:hypothetical protein
MRRLFSFLLVYVVLLTQGIAPVSSSLAAARALDPLSHAILCSELAETGQSSKDHHGPADDHCPQCSVALSSFALAPAQQADLSAPPNFTAIADWLFRDLLAIGTYAYGIAQARAPPSMMI